MHLQSRKNIFEVLRISVAMCFIGHGAFGIITKAIWCNYFAVFGIGTELAYRLMPVVGLADILLGILMIVHPARAIFAWLIFWGSITALLRPLSGEPVAEFIERAGNFGAPLCLLLLTGIPTRTKDWFTRISWNTSVNPGQLQTVRTGLQIVCFSLLAGHGWLNLIGKNALLKQYESIGLSDPFQAAHIIGVAEIALAMLILFKPLRPVIFCLFIWKMGSEMFYPQYGLFEWIERGGSYGALLALWLVTAKPPAIHLPADSRYNLQRV